MTKITYIPGEIANAAIDEHGNRKPVTRTHHIFDDAKGKKQSEINEEFGNAIGGLNNQNYVTVDSFNALPDTGEADTVYRVSNWDGSQQDPTVYSEYAWDGSQYVHLSTKTQIGEVFDISAYHATGGTLATYADLSAALDSNNGGGVPQSLQKGGMSVKYVRSSDNRYVQYRLMADTWSIDTEDWVIADEGVYVDNPEFVYVKTDKDNKILLAIKTDGGIYYGAGVPQQVVDYIEKKIADLSLDEYEDIVAFLNGLEEGDKTLQTLLDEKVDKEEGKSLIDVEYASSQSVIDNPEYLQVTTDIDDKILEGIKQDGTKVIGGDLEVGGNTTIGGDIKVLGNMEVSGVSYKIVENSEYLAAWVDAEDKVIFGLKTDGKTYVGDADFLDDIESIKVFLANFNDKNIDWDALTSITATENPEYIEVKTDSEGKLLAGRTPDGAAFENVGFSTPKVSIDGHTIDNIEDPEGRSEVTTDSEGKIISYRDGNGVKHEEVGIKANNISLSNEGKDSIINIVKELYPNPTNWSDKEYLEIPMPKCAVMNITNIREMPTTKTDDLQAIIEVWDMQGNYFKKTAIINAQGNSSLSHAKKNFALDFLNGEWDEDSTFVLKIGNWVSQDSFHFKAYYTDFFVGIPVIGYKLYNDMVLTRSIYADRTWKRALLPSNQDIGTVTGSMSDYDYNLCLDSGARCFPDGFPLIVYLNGEYYGIFCWQLKKHRDNYHQTKDDGKHIHLDGNICSDLLWTADGTIDWFKWAGITYETGSLNHDGIEVRNPKDLVLRNGGKYDFDTIHAYPSTVDIKSIEPVGEEDAEYATLMAEAEAITDEKKRKKRIKQIKYTAAVKQSVINLSEVITTLSNAEGTESAESMKALIGTYFDVDSMIDYQIFCDITNNVDGIKKNWQWNTWDGDKWAVNPYDLDGIFGIYGADGSPDQQPRNNHIGNVSDNPCYWVLKYFNTELEARYGELRRKKIIDAERIASELNNWTLNIGLDNYERELEKWPNRRNDNIYRFRNWCIESIENMDSVYHYSE